MESQTEIRKLHALIQKYLFKGNCLLMLTNQNRTLFIILIDQNKVWCIKIKQRSEKKRVLGTAVRLTIFSNIQLIKKKFGSSIDGHVKEQCWNNEASRFIIFKVKNTPWKNIKDHISARKGSVTYYNFEVSWRTQHTVRNLITEDWRKVSILYDDMK